MPEHIRYSECGVTLLGLVINEPKPLAQKDCQNSGGSDFAPLSRDDERSLPATDSGPRQ